MSADGTGVPEQTDPMNSSIHAQLRALGLKLEPRKATIKHTIVDRVEKIPTAN